MTDLINGGTTLKPGIPRHDYEPTPKLFEEFARLEPSEQAEVIDVLKRMARGQSFNDAIGEVRGREGGNTVAPKSWHKL